MDSCLYIWVLYWLVVYCHTWELLLVRLQFAIILCRYTLNQWHVSCWFYTASGVSPIALRKAKIVCNLGLPNCNRLSKQNF